MIKKILAKVVNFEDDTKSGKKSKTLKVADGKKNVPIPVDRISI